MTGITRKKTVHRIGGSLTPSIRLFPGCYVQP